MRTPSIVAVTTLVVGLVCFQDAGVRAAAPRAITLADRIAAQEAIERVYYSYQLGATRPFEEAVPREVIERKVRTSLEQSAELAERWGRPVSAEMLQAELDRIANDTRFPDRLEQIYRALGEDPVLIRECFVRPVLVERLARGRFPETDRRGLPDSLETDSRRSVESVSTQCSPDDTWTPTATFPAPYGHAAVWTGNVMLIWGGSLGSGAGERYDPLTDTWSLISTVGEPNGPTDDLTAVWTGHFMVVWGGFDCPVGCGPAGGRYDPVSDSWLPISTSGSPGGRVYHSVVWTGTRMIVWGGDQGGGLYRLNSGAVYDPEADVWTTTSTVGVPVGRAGHAAVWTGSRMIVWGGYGVSGPLGSGGRYDPATNTWAPTSTVGAPSPRYNEFSNLAAVWTGSRMVVWGGTNGSTLFATGGRYNPVADSWSPVSIAGSPEARQEQTAVWTGHQMLAWGGRGASGLLASGGRYDPLTNQWGPMSPASAPSARELHTAVWTGNEMIVWGGTPATNIGGRYAIGQLTDDDGDGVSECAGDCDDTRADVHPGAAEVCDGRDDNCDGFIPPEGADLDQDGVRDCAGDCDDSNPTRFPGNLELCDAVDNDCDGSVDGHSTSCGVGGCARSGVCTFGVDSCVPGAPAAEVCNGIDDDCNGVLLDPEADFDGDGVSICAGDCDDGYPFTFRLAPEVNDTVDNQCPGDAGFGLVDEVSGTSGFSTPGDPTQFCWPGQLGATNYLALRSSGAGFSVGCASAETAGTCWSDPTVPAARTVLYYLVRVEAPNPGSLGARSSGTERAAVCGAEFACGDGVDDDGDGRVDCADLSDCYGVGACDSAALTFTDGPGDDLATQALKDFFVAVPEDVSDYLHFSLAGPTLTDFEWCAARADFYGSSYLALAPTSGTVASGAWDKWQRTQGGSWIGPDSAGYDNLFGDDCAGAFSWCSEVGLGGHIPGLAPAEASGCEVFDDIDCSDGTWTLSIKVGVSRAAACGF